MLDVPETIATTMEDYVTIAARLGQDKQYRQTISARMAATRDKVYRDRAPVTALEDFIERSVRG
jgi:predicted O-linked N-acetylglucosamine transferase (SPINDLY family)